MPLLTAVLTAVLTDTTITQPVFFIPHGAGPCFFMDWQPHDEAHLLPLMMAAGAAGVAEQDAGRQVYSELVLKTQLSAFQFG